MFIILFCLDAHGPIMSTRPETKSPVKKKQKLARKDWKRKFNNVIGEIESIAIRCCDACEDPTRELFLPVIHPYTLDLVRDYAVGTRQQWRARFDRVVRRIAREPSPRGEYSARSMLKYHHAIRPSCFICGHLYYYCGCAAFVFGKKRMDI